MNATDYLLQNGLDENAALEDIQGTFAYGRLRHVAARLAGELHVLGLLPGDRVGIVGQNSLFWIASYLAIMKLGMVAVPLSTVLTPADLCRDATWVGCKAVCIDRFQLPKFEEAIPKTVFQLHDSLLFADGPLKWPSKPSNFDENCDAALMFTSGTTARPKVVRITHRNIQANTDSIIDYLGLCNTDCMLVILPFCYCFGTSLLHTHLRVGGRLVLCNSFAFPETAVDMMEASQCTGFAGVPSSFQMLLRMSTFAKRRLPHLKKMQQAGGSLHNILIQELVAVKPKVELFVMYGQTEATARLSYLPPEMVLSKLGSIGRGIPGVELRVISEEGIQVSAGAVGEIVARGDNIAPGYFNDEASSVKKFVNGVLFTGDLATVDEDGYIYVTDRAEDFIKSWGYRVSSQEIESCALQMPDVVSAAAVGVPSLSAGEAIHLYVTLRPGSKTTAESIAVHCRRNLARHVLPEAFTIVNSLPLNANGKVVKSELRRLAVERRQNGNRAT